MSDKRILFISQEIAPYLSQERRLAAQGRDLSTKMQGQGYEVRLFMPKYSTINERRNQLHEVIRLSGMNIPIGNDDHPLILKVASLQPSRIQVYFIDNDELFTESSDDPTGINRTDTDERAIFFARGSVETLKKLRWSPSIINCSGWISALIPLYIKNVYSKEPTVVDSKVIYHVSDSSLANQFDAKYIDKLKADGISAEALSLVADRKPDVDALHRIGIKHADAVIFDTPSVDQNLLKFARRHNKKVLLKKTILENPEAYVDFYNSIITDEK